MKVIALLLTMGLASAAAAAQEVTAEQVRTLEAQCEAAREAKLKPLRDAEIERCKAQKRTDPGYCERFYSDLGNATRRPNGTMTPRMFDDLPECIAAAKARSKLANQ
ncbi:MAG TPA: hypothetical protein VFR96_19270 [Povalibacter sp.]|nr:hypothetical protein [Povalibacter sp.]